MIFVKISCLLAFADIYFWRQRFPAVLKNGWTSKKPKKPKHHTKQTKPDFWEAQFCMKIVYFLKEKRLLEKKHCFGEFLIKWDGFFYKLIFRFQTIRFGHCLGPHEWNYLELCYLRVFLSAEESPEQGLCSISHAQATYTDQLIQICAVSTSKLKRWFITFGRRLKQ